MWNRNEPSRAGARQQSLQQRADLRGSGQATISSVFKRWLMAVGQLLNRALPPTAKAAALLLAMLLILPVITPAAAQVTCVTDRTISYNPPQSDSRIGVGLKLSDGTCSVGSSLSPVPDFAVYFFQGNANPPGQDPGQIYVRFVRPDSGTINGVPINWMGGDLVWRSGSLTNDQRSDVEILVTTGSTTYVMTADVTVTATSVTVHSFVVDGGVFDITAPTVTEETAVTTPTTDATPDVTIRSNEDGDVTYGGSCTGNVNTISADTDTTITLEASVGGNLADDTYSDCTVTVTDAAGNASTALTLTPFTVSGSGNAPEIAVSSSESGDVTNGGTDTHTGPEEGTPKTVTYTVSNSGSAALTVSAITASSLSNILGSVTIAPSALSVTQNDGSTDGEATFNVTYTPAADGTYSFQLSLTNNDSDETPYIINVSGTATADITPPTASASSNSPQTGGATGELYSTGSSDAGSGIASYAWLQVDGATSDTQASSNVVTLSDASSASPTFTVPSLSANAELYFKLTVTDNAGNSTSAWTTYVVTVDTTAPTVSITTDSPGAVGTTATLDGSGSSDAGGIASYAWIQVTALNSDMIPINTNNMVTLTNADTSQATFTVPSFDSDTNLYFKLTVTDNAGNSASAWTTYVAEEDERPVVTEVTAVTTPTNDTTPDVVIQSDQVGDITYGGSCQGNIATISQADTDTIITLSSDGSGGDLSDAEYSNCTITVTNSTTATSELLTLTAFTVDTTAPTASASNNGAQTGGATGSLNGSGSSDTGSGIASYAWLQVDAVRSHIEISSFSDSYAALTNADMSIATFTVPSLSTSANLYFKLTITDNAGNSSSVWTTYEVTADTAAPTVSSVVFQDGSGTPITSAAPGDSFQVVVTFSEAMDNSSPPSLAFLDATGGTGNTIDLSTWAQTASNGWSSSDTIYTFNFTAPDPLAASVAIRSTKISSINDVAGNALSEHTEDDSLDVDENTAPTITVTSLTTNDTTPALSGTVDDNAATISITVDSQTVTATNNGDGTWTLTDNALTTALAEGTYNVAASATDTAGNIGTDGTTDELTIDITAPTITVASLITNDTTPALNGTVNDNAATISITVDSQTVTATNNGDGTWTLADNLLTTALAEGTYDVAASATDAAGNIGTDGTIDELTIDTTAPTITVTALITNDTTPALSGTVNNSTASISITVDSQTVAATNNGDGTWTLADNLLTTVLAEGTYDVAASATDTAGNTGTDGTTDELTIDITAPTITVTALTSSDTTPALSGAVDDNTATISITVDSQTVTATNNGDGTWTLADNALTTALAEGTYNVAASATDAAGNTGTDGTTDELTIDTTAPTITVTSLITNDTTPALNGTVNDNAATISITVDSQTVTATNNGDGTWTLADNLLTTALAEGTYDVAASATDTAGNTGTDGTTDELTIDTAVPTLTISAPGEARGPFTATFTFSEIVTGFALADITVGNGTASDFAGTDDVYTAIITPTEHGTVTLDVAAAVAIDGAGNDNAAADQVSVNYIDENYVQQRTSRIISNFMTRRGDAIVSNQPDFTERLNQAGPGSSGAGASFSGEGSYANNRMNFATSLRQMLAANKANKDQRIAGLRASRGASGGAGQEGGQENGQQGGQTEGRGDGLKIGQQGGGTQSLGFRNLSANDGAPAGFDLWIRGRWARYENDTNQGDVGLLFIGADYKFNNNFVLGLVAQFDWTDEVDDTDDFKINGRGWMVGPYLVAQLHQNLIFDANFSWGQSDNEVSPFNTYTDSFDGTRWLASAKFTGSFTFGSLHVAPHIGVLYFQERQEAYVDSLSIDIPSQTVKLGRLSFGPKISTTIERKDGTTISPYLGLKGLWDFERSAIVDLTTGLASESTDDIRARVDAGVRIRLPDGLTLNGEGFYDGLGAKDYKSYGGSIRINIPLQRDSSWNASVLGIKSDKTTAGYGSTPGDDATPNGNAAGRK